MDQVQNDSMSQQEHVPQNDYQPTAEELQAELNAEFDRQAEEYENRDIPDGLF